VFQLPMTCQLSCKRVICQQTKTYGLGRRFELEGANFFRVRVGIRVALLVKIKYKDVM